MKLVLAGQAKTLEPLNLQGIYHLQKELVNSYPYWNQVNGSNAIWFRRKDVGEWWKINKSYRHWHVGQKKNLGGDIGKILGPRGIDISPSRITSGWRYHSDGWKEAAHSEIIFQDLSSSK